VGKKLDDSYINVMEYLESIPETFKKVMYSKDIEHYEIKLRIEVSKKRGGTFCENIDVVNGMTRRKWDEQKNGKR
jgi:hypothetical protein